MCGYVNLYSREKLLERALSFSFSQHVTKHIQASKKKKKKKKRLCGAETKSEAVFYCISFVFLFFFSNS